MTELIRMWSNSRMVVLTALTAALYSALTVPFKAIVLIPGFTEIRPTAAIPALMGVLCGPAGAWGAGFGNVIGDAYGGTFGPGTLFGFLGNMGFAYAAYKLSRNALWRRTESVDAALERRARLAGRLILIVIGTALGTGAVAFSPFIYAGPTTTTWSYVWAVVAVALGLAIAGLALSERACRYASGTLPVALGSSLVCGGIIGWGLDLLQFVPFGSLGVLIAINNTLAVGVLLPLLLPSIHPRMKRWGLCVEDLMKPEDLSSPRAPALGRALIWVGVLGLYVVGVGGYLGRITGMDALGELTVQGRGVALWQIPFIGVVVLGLWKS